MEKCTDLGDYTISFAKIHDRRNESHWPVIGSCIGFKFTDSSFFYACNTTSLTTNKHKKTGETKKQTKSAHTELNCNRQKGIRMKQQQKLKERFRFSCRCFFLDSLPWSVLKQFLPLQIVSSFTKLSCLMSLREKEHTPYGSKLQFSRRASCICVF